MHLVHRHRRKKISRSLNLKDCRRIMTLLLIISNGTIISRSAYAVCSILFYEIVLEVKLQGVWQLIRYILLLSLMALAAYMPVTHYNTK